MSVSKTSKPLPYQKGEQAKDKLITIYLFNGK